MSDPITASRVTQGSCTLRFSRVGRVSLTGSEVSVFLLSEHEINVPIVRSKIILFSFVVKFNLIGGLPITFLFVTAWVFEGRHCPVLPNEIKKTNFKFTLNPAIDYALRCAARLRHVILNRVCSFLYLFSVCRKLTDCPMPS